MSSAAPPGIGTKLRNARVDLSLSIEETAWRTRIRPDVLRALEDEEFDEMGHQAFVRSHLVSYARFLGMDAAEVADEFVANYEEAMPSSIDELNRQVRVAKKPPRAKWFIAAAVCGSVLIAGAAVGLLGGQGERPTAEVSPAAIGSPARVVAAADVRVSLTIAASHNTETSVRTDGVQVFEGTLAAGSSRTFRGREVIEIVVADAGVVRLNLNGKDLGAPGKSGSVLRERFGPNGRLAE